MYIKRTLDIKYKTYKYIILIILVLGAYYNSLKTPFLLDDKFRIVNNPDITKLSNIPSKLIYPHNNTKTFENYWMRNDPSRPVVFLTYTINYHFGGLAPFGYHLINIILHIFNVILFFLLGSFLTRELDNRYSGIIPLYAAMLFAVSPVNADAVSYIFGRSNLLASLFYFSSILFFIRTVHRHPIYLPLSLLFFILALFSKQISVTLPLIILIIDYIFISRYHSEKITARLSVHTSYWTILILYLLFRLFFFGAIGDIEAGATWDRFQYICIQPYIILNYVRLILLPAGLSLVHIIDKPSSVFDLRIIIPFAVFISISLLGKKTFIRKPVQLKYIIFCVLWFIITLLPTSSFFPTTQAMVERRVYLPGFGIYFLITAAYIFLLNLPFIKRTTLAGFKSRYIIFSIMTVHILALLILTHNRNRLLNNPVRLWSRIAEKYPTNDIAHNELGLVFLDKGDYKSALKEFRIAISLDPKKPEYYSSMGKYYLKKERYLEAVSFFSKALAINPQSFSLQNDLGVTYFNNGNYELALKHYNYSLTLKSDYAPTYNNIGSVYYMLKDYHKAVNFYEKSLALNPYYPSAYYNLGLTQLQLNNYFKAKDSFLLAIECGYRKENVFIKLADIYYRENNIREAIMIYKKAHKIFPGSNIISNNLKALLDIHNKSKSE